MLEIAFQNLHMRTLIQAAYWIESILLKENIRSNCQDTNRGL